MYFFFQVEVNHPDEINEIFDAISYEKGCALIRMMVSFLSEGTFFKGINRYLQTYQFSNAFQVLCMSISQFFPAILSVLYRQA